MAFVVAMAGKGGTGKTTVAGLIISGLIKKNKGSILAVDADANSNLNEVLGAEVKETVGKIREEVTQVPQGMTKDSYIGYRVQEALIEGKGFDLIAMGRPEGAGCYCYANLLCKKYVDILADNYNYVIIDNEAGLEHMSRRTTHSADLLIIVIDSSHRGVLTAGRISSLADELKLKIKKKVVILNRVEGEIPQEVIVELEKANLELGCVLPSDVTVREFDEKGIPTLQLPDDNPVSKRIDEFIDKYLVN